MSQPPIWTTYEVIESATGLMPVSFAIAGKGVVDAEKATDTMWRLQQMVREMGWQKARTTYKYNRGKKSEPRVVHKGGLLWLLKCKPSCWRLYFYSDEARRQLVYLRAVCKKKDKENAQDSIKAINIISAIAAGQYSIVAFVFPS